MADRRPGDVAVCYGAPDKAKGGARLAGGARPRGDVRRLVAVDLQQPQRLRDQEVGSSCAACWGRHDGGRLTTTLGLSCAGTGAARAISESKSARLSRGRVG